MVYFVSTIKYEVGLFVVVYEKLYHIISKTCYLTVGIIWHHFDLKTLSLFSV